MRTKQLLITAALTAAGISAASAASHSEAVFSANAVGFVNVDLVNGFNLIANPLNADDNSIGALLGDVPNGSTVFKYNGTSFDSSTKDLFTGAWSDDSIDLSPGAGFWVDSAGAATITFVGEVNQGDASNMAVGSGFQLLGSLVPQAGALEADLGYAANGSDAVFEWDAATQAFSSSEVDLFTGTWSNGDPQIAVAEGFWLRATSAGNWTRDFSVN